MKAEATPRADFSGGARARRALCCAVVLLLAAHGGAVRAQDESAQAEARAAYTAGVEAFGHADYARAQQQFTQAETKFPSPNIELMLGRSLAKLDRLLEAHRMLTQARDNAGQIPKYANAASAARDELAELEKRLGKVRVRVIAPHGDETLRVNGEPLPPIAWASPIVVPAGRVRLELSRPGTIPETRELTVAAGATSALELRLESPSAPAAAPEPSSASPTKPTTTRAELPEPPTQPLPARTADAAHGGRGHQLRGFSYALAGVGVLGLGAFGVFGAMSHSEFGTLEAGCPEAERCDPRLRDNATRGQTYQTLANIALVAGAAALTTGVTLWIVSLPEESAEVAITPGSVQLRGSF